MVKISAVINTLNEERNLPRALSSLGDFVNEIVVCDMYSDDKTVEIAKKFKAKIFNHERTNYVEPARNFAISKATGDWVLILDADEEIPESLKRRLFEIVSSDEAECVSIPRKNIIFGKWIEHSRWWPDYVIRFFKKGKVKWSDRIHSVPETNGRKLELPASGENAIIHHNYDSLDQYLERLFRYSKIQAVQLKENGYQFTWQDLIRKPAAEFLSRYFVGEGYKDGIHGLALSLLQAFSELVLVIRVWEDMGYQQGETPAVLEQIGKTTKDIRYWVAQKEKNPLKRILRKLKV